MYINFSFKEIPIVTVDEVAPEAKATVSQEVSTMMRIIKERRPYLKSEVKEEAKKVRIFSNS